jgi:LuxR family maltose regulon positive regulatory protein
LPIGAAAAAPTGGWNGASLALAERAAIAISRDDWLAAEALVEQAEAVVRRSRMGEYPTNALVFAVAARVAVHRREPKRASELLSHAQRLRLGLTRVVTPLAVQTRLELAAAYAGLPDPAGARTILREAQGLTRGVPDLGQLAGRLADLESKLESARSEVPGASTLTTAELRLLPMLPTQMSFPEIGERLFLSRHTVKSQAVSIYRKLNVTTRTAAVERSQELGLL